VNTRPRSIAFREKPLPEYRPFWITETTASYRLNDHNTNRWKNRKLYEKLLYTWELGLMQNTSPRVALGGSVFLDYDDYLDNTRFGARFRYCRWLTRSLSLDLSPGVILTGGNASGPAVSGCVTIDTADMIALSLRLDVNGSGSAPGNRFSWFGGARFCSYPGLVVGIAGPVIAAMIWGQKFNMHKR